MKKLSIITSVVLCILILIAAATPAFSGASYIIINNFKLTKNSDGTLMVAGYEDKTATSITIPNDFYGNLVTTIDQRAFANNTVLTSITLPSSLTEIGNGAFSGCTALESISIPSSVTKIGSNAFYECESMTSVEFNDAPLTQISPYAFNRCRSLRNVVIPDTVEKIGEYAFFLCQSLESAEISSSAMRIDQYAFYSCSNLTHVLIKSSRDDLTIADTAFDDLTFGSLTIQGVVGSDSERYAKENNINFEPYDGEPQPQPKKGDANADGSIDSNDVTLCLKYAVRLIGDEDINLDLADINEDGIVNVKDATIIQKTVVGLI